jgi:hypothetical protein
MKGTFAMAKRKSKSAELPAANEPTTVLGKKHIRRKYSAGDDYKAWKAHCDQLKVDSAFHSSEATRLRNEFKKCYENGADGFCTVRDDQAWEKANNLITLAEMKESERANAWKKLPVEKLGVPKKIMNALKKNCFSTLAEVSDWCDVTFPEHKKGITPASVEIIKDVLNKFVAPYHAPIAQKEIEEAKAIQKELTA